MCKLFIGGDISKDKIDFAVFDGKQFLLTCEVNNTETDILKFLKRVDNLVFSLQETYLTVPVMYIFEHTGIYNNHVVRLLLGKGSKLALIHPGVLKAVVTVERGKNDIYDSKRIAEYGFRFEDKLACIELCQEEMSYLKVLMKHRQKLVKQLSQLKADQNDNSKFLDKNLNEILKKNTMKIKESLRDAIEDIEAKIEQIIKENEDLRINYELVKSVPGIGKITAAALIIYTENFSKFDDSKKLGSYCGVVPFVRSSGQFKGKARVSIKANKIIKTLLHLCALSAIGGQNHFSEYYKRKTEVEGKNKMSVINAIRNKILKTAFSCVKQHQKYDLSFIYKQQVA